MLDHSTFWCEISLKNCNTSICTNSVIVRTDNIILSKINIVSLVEFLKPLITLFIEAVVLKFLKVLTKCLTCYCHNIKVQMLLYLFHDSWNATSIIEAFCVKYGYVNYPCRFDVIAIYKDGTIKHIKNAFEYS